MERVLKTVRKSVQVKMMASLDKMRAFFTQSKAFRPNRHEGTPPNQSLLEQMRNDWDRRAKENARHFIATGKQHWTDDEFIASGRLEVTHQILTDMTNICQGRLPGEMRVLEVGCGSGRVTWALARVFGEVHAVDISGEMIRNARVALKKLRNVHLYQNNGQDLTVLPHIPFDFAFSTIVFQHIPSYEVIESYISEVGRLLRPGALFKFQVQGYLNMEREELDTWVGVPISEQQVFLMAARYGFECRYQSGAGTQHYWLWFFKHDQTPSHVESPV